MNTKALENALQNLRSYWGFESFREGQDQAIKSVLEGEDTLVLFPTGGGKSLCYQVPATVMEGMTLVISPLVALMQDQVQQLNDRGISATFINSTLSSWEVEQRLVNARNGMYKLLYCAPERLKTTIWEAELPRLNIDLIAVDEAHCISEWGHDFRPSYREIRSSLELIEDSATWLALTATATPEVRKDIIENLGFQEPVIISKGFDRPNLKWWVAAGENKLKKLLQGVNKASQKGSGLIYGGTRKNCEKLANLIRDKLDINTAYYHAGIDNEERSAIQKQWVAGELQLVVATNAFGMGIDKADCRYVIHYQMPYSLESYYQEAGRAGRDGKESFPLLLYKPSDMEVAVNRLKSSYPEKKQLQKVYDAVCDSFELAVGAGMEQAEEISMEALKRRSGLSYKVTRSSLNLLNRLGMLQLVDNVTSQVGLRFVVSEEYIMNLTENLDNKQKAEFIDRLYRLFGSEAFKDLKYLDTEYLQRKLDVSKNGLLKGLQVLQAYDHLITYEALGELPLVKILEARHRKLPFSRAELEKHRQNLLKKLDYMQGYIETETCREIYLRSYFGETDLEPCGHCDNCLSGNMNVNIEITSHDLRVVRELLTGEGKSMTQIIRETGFTKNRAQKVLSHMIREGKVESFDSKYVWSN